MGFLKTLYKVRERFFWPRMAGDIKNYVESCKDCQSYKIRHRRNSRFTKLHVVPGNRNKPKNKASTIRTT